MKKQLFFRKVSGNRRSDILQIVLIIILLHTFISCSKSDIEGISLPVSENLVIAKGQAMSKTTISEIQFTATALIEYCYGENIQFTGTIQNRLTKTTDANGTVHFSRSFRTREMTGIGLITATEFDVLGGSEMFAIKDAVFNDNGNLNLAGSLNESDIVIHEGTLVFQSREDGSKIIARHIIRKVPGQSGIINKWVCQGK